MKRLFNKIIIFIFFFVVACSSTLDDVKKGLGGKKRTTTDEFLVKKKEPLTLPPKFDDLPEPGKDMEVNEIREVTDIEDLIQLGNREEIDTLKTNKGESLEQSVLEKIKK